MTFELPLAEEKVKPHQVTGLHLLTAFTFTGAGAVLYAFYKQMPALSIALIVAGILLALVTIFRNKQVMRSGTAVRIIELAILAGLTVFALMHKWTPAVVMFGVLGAAILFSIFWERSSGGVQTIKLDTSGIKLPLTSRSRHIAWPEIEQVLFRYGILTVNCYDNRLFQWSIRNVTIDNGNFEAFCLQQIEEGRKAKDKNDW